MMTLGEMLKAERKKRGCTTLDVSHATRIMQSSVKALEDNCYDLLPAPGYVRGYILSYCRFLRVDPTPYLQQYEADTGNVRHPAIENLAVNKTAVEKQHAQHDIPWRMVIIIALVIALIAAGVFFGMRLLNHDSEEILPAPVTTSTATNEDATADNDRDISRQKPFTFTIQVKEGAASELTVEADGIEAYDGTLTAGEKKTFDAQGKAIITAANPAALTVKRGDTSIKLPTKANEPLTITAQDPK